MQTLQSTAAFEELKNDGATVWYFTTTWCPDCHFIEPALPEIEANFSNYRFVKVDRDEHIDLCAALEIYGIPSFIVTKDGKELGRYVNKERKTQAQVEQFLQSL